MRFEYQNKISKFNFNTKDLLVNTEKKNSNKET